MKKNYFVAGLLCCCMAGAFWSCDDPGSGNGGNGGNGGDTPNGDPGLGGTMEKLEPSAQKARLQEVGLEFVNNIKTGDHENLVDVVDYLEENLEFDIDTAYIGKLERLYEETYEGDNDYYYSSPVMAVRNLMAISLDAAQSGAQLSTRATDIWTTTLKTGLPDVYGLFTPDMENEEWKWDSSVNDRLEVSFADDHNQKWVATLKGSKETTRAKVTVRFKEEYKTIYGGGPDAGTEIGFYDDYYEFVIDVPKQLTFTVRCNNNNVVDLTVNSSLAFDGNFVADSKEVDYREWYEWVDEYWDEWYDYETGNWVGDWVTETHGYYEWMDEEWTCLYSFDVDYTNLNVDAKLKVNAYEETFKTDITKQGMAASASVKINGQHMLKAEGALKADIDAAIEEGSDALNEEKDFDEIKINALKEFSMFVDIMGKVQVVGKCDKFEDLLDALVDVEEAEDFVKYDRNVQQVNKAYSITLHYDNTETVQANVEAEAYQWEDEWNDGFIFSTRPVIVFTSDESRYSFEDYFTERSFSDLVESVEDLFEDFENMFDRYFEEEVENEYYPDYREDYYK